MIFIIDCITGAVLSGCVWGGGGGWILSVHV